MKRTSFPDAYILTLVLLAQAGCASNNSAPKGEPNPLLVATAVVGGAVVGTVAAPIALPVAVINGANRKEQLDTIRARLDPIYADRAARLWALDPVGDAANAFDSGCVVFLPAIPSGSYYPGASSWKAGLDTYKFPSGEKNWVVLCSRPELVEAMRLMENDPSHPRDPAGPLYLSEVYRAFLSARSFYRSTFNEAMLRRFKELPAAQLDPAAAAAMPAARQP